MNGMFEGTDGNMYDIDVPSPYLHNTKKEALKDSFFAYRFFECGFPEYEVYLPVLGIFEKEDHKGFTENDKRYIEVSVSGSLIKYYTYEEFKKLNGSIRLLKPEVYKNDRLLCLKPEDFVSTNKTFEEIFPKMVKNKYYYIDSEAYYIEEIEQER